jgi:hypothetical protein
MKHNAYNLTTGEIISTASGNHLKRCVRICVERDAKLGYPCGPWIFNHSGINAIMAKANRYGRLRVKGGRA